MQGGKVPAAVVGTMATSLRVLESERQKVRAMLRARAQAQQSIDAQQNTVGSERAQL